MDSLINVSMYTNSTRTSGHRARKLSLSNSNQKILSRLNTSAWLRSMTTLLNSCHAFLHWLIAVLLWSKLITLKPTLISTQNNGRVCMHKLSMDVLSLNFRHSPTSWLKFKHKCHRKSRIWLLCVRSCRLYSSSESLKPTLMARFTHLKRFIIILSSTRSV